MPNTTSTIEISDFGPGIYGDHHAGTGSDHGGVPAVNGAATIEGTYRCCADQTGALVPLPARQAGTTQTIMPNGTTGNLGSTHRPAGLVASYVMDAMVVPGFEISTAVPTQDAVMILHSYYYDIAGASNPRHYWLGRLYRPWNADSLDILYARSAATVNWRDLPGGHIIATRHLRQDTTHGTGPYSVASTHIVTGVAGAERTATTASGVAYSGAELAVTTHDTDNTGGAAYDPVLAVYPPIADPYVSNNSLLFDIIGEPNDQVRYLVGHQARAVAALRRRSQLGPSSQVYATDPIMYTAVAGDLSTSAVFGVYGEENTAQTSFLASTSADELLIMRHSGGGILVRGDLSNPTVTRLPYLESTYGVTYRPVATPLGLFYASLNGIFLWAGGDTAKKMSNQIEGFFFRHESAPTTEIYTGSRGRMGWWHPFVCVPNNFLLDTRTGSWWRLENEPTIPAFNCYDTSSETGVLYAFPYKATSTATTAWYTYSAAVLSSSYAWRSQPLVETRDRLIKPLDVTLVASSGSSTGTCTVAVTLTGFLDNGTTVTYPATFTWTGGGEAAFVVQKADIPGVGSLKACSYVRVALTATATSGPAPKIHSIKIGIAEHARRAKVAGA